jgi:hypothetical protein
MTKRIKKIAMLTIATVVIGVASLTSCTKDDEVINDVPAMDLKVEKVHYTAIKFYWWWLTIETDRWGNQDSIWNCIIHHVPQGLLCGMSIEGKAITDPGIVIATWFETNGTIGRLEIESSNMPLEMKNSFLQYAEEGTVTFAVNCPITDPELLAVSENDHIPAGTYPIRFENENFVITISE